MLRKIAAIVFLSTLLFPEGAILNIRECRAQSSTPARMTLEDGTPVKLRIARNVSSADAKTGEQVDFEVLEEIKVGDLVIIPKSGIAWGTVTNAQPKRRMGRGGKLDMTIDSVRLVTGEKAALRAVKELKGGGSTGAMTAGIVATSLIVWPAAPFFLFMHGKDITIPKGTEITAYINGNFNLDKAKLGLPASAPESSHVEATGVSVTNVSLASIPEGAEVEIDGSFVGNSPIMVDLPAGEHSIVVKKKGYKAWERKLKTTGGIVKVSPELEKD